MHGLSAISGVAEVPPATCPWHGPSRFDTAVGGDLRQGRLLDDLDVLRLELVDIDAEAVFDRGLYAERAEDLDWLELVVMQGKKRIDYKFEPIKVIGTFRIKPTIEDGFCVDIYQLEIEKVEIIK